MNTILELLFPLTVAGSIVVVCLLLLRLVPIHVLPSTWRYGMSKMAVGFYLLPVVLGIQWISQLFTFNTGQYSWFNPEPIIRGQMISANVVLPFISLWAIGTVAFAAWQTYCLSQIFEEIGIFTYLRSEE